MIKQILCYAFAISLNTFAYGQSAGCTDPIALNYNPSATVNNGSCTYQASSVSANVSYTLSNALQETSGLIFYDNGLWTHNDNTDHSIYKLDTLNGALSQDIMLPLINVDWEDISQDSNYIYIGDFGNNVSGNRTDLKIVRILKSTLHNTNISIDTIHFSYSNQMNMNPVAANQTDFDCESFIVTQDSIFLFTKQWSSLNTSVYSLPKTPGTYSAQLKQTYNIQGLITGATALPEKKLIVLNGYSPLLQPSIYLLYDYSGTDFFSGNKRKITLNLPFHQTEGITTHNGLKYYISNEYFSNNSFSSPQKLHVFNLANYLQHYLNNPISSVRNDDAAKISFSLYPNPCHDYIMVSENCSLPYDYKIINSLGQLIEHHTTFSNTLIPVTKLEKGLYYFTINESKTLSFKFIKE